MPHLRPPLLIVGASARAAASSAHRAGFAPTAIDLFADRDLADRFPAHRVERSAYPAGMIDIAAQLPDSPWIYTGALENHPHLIDRLAETRQLLGISGSSLRAVRDPNVWARVLRANGLTVPEFVLAGDPPPTSGEWILKPLASGGGQGVRRWTIGEGPITPGHQLQQLIDGRSFGATFIGDGRSARVVGCAWQLQTRSMLYAGSIGPMRPTVMEPTIRAIGGTLASAFALRGLFGVDMIRDVYNQPWPIEINPRYSASVEVLEAALGAPLLAEHARAFGIKLGMSTHAMIRRPRIFAKRVIYATRPAVVPDLTLWRDPQSIRSRVADIPSIGTRLAPGDPILTILVASSSGNRLRKRLEEQCRLWIRRIASWPEP